MTNVSNSDSEQCTESKLSRVHSAPTLGPSCTRTASCRRPGLAVSQRAPVVSHIVPHAVSLRVTRLPGSVTAPARPCRGLSRDTTQQPSLRLSRYNRLYHDTLLSGQASLLSRYNDCIVTHSTIQAARALPTMWKGISDVL